MKKNIFYILAFTILFISCKKDADSLAPLNFPKEALDYVQIPLKKYFIYKDSVTGYTDSVIITQNALETKLMPANQSKGPIGWNSLPYNYQTFTLLLSKVNGTTSTDWFYGIANASDSYGLGSADLWLAEKDRSTDKIISYAFHYPHTNGGITPYVLINIPNITIEGKDYSDVVQFTNNSYQSPSSPDYFTSTYYWAKGIGIIKRTLKTATSTQTWTLLRKG